MYWAILRKAGFPADEARLRSLGLASRHVRHFDPHFNNGLRVAAHHAIRNAAPPGDPSNLDELVAELEVFAQVGRDDPTNAALMSSSRPMFEPDDVALLEFLSPPDRDPALRYWRPYLAYHSPHAGDFVKEILKLLDDGKTVILDLGNATDEIRRYFADMLSRDVFATQEKKFVSNSLGSHHVQLYFEEANNIFPVDNKDMNGVYARFAKEGPSSTSVWFIRRSPRRR